MENNNEILKWKVLKWKDLEQFVGTWIWDTESQELVLFAGYAHAAERKIVINGELIDWKDDRYKVATIQTNKNKKLKGEIKNGK